MHGEGGAPETTRRSPAQRRDGGWPARAQRPEWGDIPQPVREGIEELAGGKVVRAVSHVGGFSPGLAARIELADGTKLFVKAASPSPNAETPQIHRSEARIAAALPTEASVPRFLGAYDDGTWVALLFEYIDGRPPRLPWEHEELTRVLDALGRLSRTLTPSPVRAPPIREKHAGYLQGWRRILTEQGKAGTLLAGTDPWIRKHLSALAEMEANWPNIAQGSTLLHADIRADNILLTPTRVYFVDWPWACIGAPWIDLMAMLPSVYMQGGPPPWDVFDVHPLAEGVPPDAAATYLCALTGYFLWSSLQPPPPGLPTLREFQRAQGDRALEWLKRRTGWA